MTEQSRMALSSKVQEAVSKINALRKLSRESGLITKRAQSMILRALSDDEMTAVAEILAKESTAEALLNRGEDSNV